MTTLKKTPLYETHLQSGAHMVPFAGFEMPMMFSSMIEEHQSVRSSAGLFDVSHMGEIEISGKDAVAFTNYLICNRTTDMKDGDIRYSPMCYPDGGQVDDLLAYFFNEEKMLLVVNATNIQKDLNHILGIQQQRKDLEVRVENCSDQFGQIAFQGPKAEELLQEIAEEDLSQLKFFKFKSMPIAGIKTITSRTGYTGEDGFEILSDNFEGLQKIWNLLAEKGGPRGVKPCGLGSRDTLRFEAGLWLYGNDIDEHITPLEAGQHFAVKLDKDFVGRDALLKQKESGIERTLVAMILENKLIPRHGMEIFHEDKPVGFVASGGFCPAIQKVACMGYLPPDLNQTSHKVSISIRKKTETATITSRPFYKGTSGRKDRR